MKKTVKVVAAIIENDHGEILCALRSTSMSIPNLWEFPGGKVEQHEDLHTALIREINEEMKCTIETSQEIFFNHTHEYDTFIINLIAIKSKITDGIPIRAEHDKIIWLERKNLSSLQWAPADIPIVEALINE